MKTIWKILREVGDFVGRWVFALLFSTMLFSFLGIFPEGDDEIRVFIASVTVGTVLYTTVKALYLRHRKVSDEKANCH